MHTKPILTIDLTALYWTESRYHEAAAELRAANQRKQTNERRWRNETAARARGGKGLIAHDVVGASVHAAQQLEIETDYWRKHMIAEYNAIVDQLPAECREQLEPLYRESRVEMIREACGYGRDNMRDAAMTTAREYLLSLAASTPPMSGPLIDACAGQWPDFVEGARRAAATMRDRVIPRPVAINWVLGACPDIFHRHPIAG